MSRDDAALDEAVARCLAVACAGSAPLGGEVRAVRRDDGGRVVARIVPIAERDRLEGEAAGLDALRARDALRVPRVLGLHAGAERAVLLTEHLAPAAPDESAWIAFGRGLARLHAAGRELRYGFHRPTHLGPTLQANDWSESWPAFLRARRLAPMLALARRRGGLEDPEAAAIERAIDRVDRVVPARPTSSLLHGDLWRGNAHAFREGDGATAIALVDPAVSYGDGWADVAMLRLFGGVPESCIGAYAEARGEAEDPRRLAPYRLHHFLHHVALFGRGYVAGALAAAAEIG